MVKLLVFAILLASSPATGLLESLYKSENNCYSGCYNNYEASSTHLDACKQGCDFKLHNEDCPTQCKSISADEEMQASCQVGCTLNSPEIDEIVDTPSFAVDPIPEDKTAEGTTAATPAAPAASNEQEVIRPHSIILIRLRQRPSIQVPSMPQFFGNDPIQTFNEIIRQFQERAKLFEQSLHSSLGENAPDNGQFPFPNTLSELPNAIPIMHMPMHNFDGPADEQSDHQRMMHAFQHHFGHPHGPFGHEGPEQMQPERSRLRQFFTDVNTEWNDLVRKQPKIPIWIFLAVFLSSSAILWYMIMSLCRHAPNRNALSIRAQEVVFHPYDYESYEKAKIQPDDEPYDVTESVPIKVKLTNI